MGLGASLSVAHTVGDFAATRRLSVGLCTAVFGLSACDINSDTQMMDPSERLPLRSDYRLEVRPEIAKGGYAEFFIADAQNLMIVTSYSLNDDGAPILETPVFSVAFYPVAASPGYILLESQFAMETALLLEPTTSLDAFYYGLAKCDDQGALTAFDMELSALGDTLQGPDRNFDSFMQSATVTSRAALLELVSQAIAGAHYFEIEPDGDIDPFLGAIKCSELFMASL